jgi:hypothetical protein
MDFGSLCACGFLVKTDSLRTYGFIKLFGSLIPSGFQSCVMARLYVLGFFRRLARYDTLGFFVDMAN